MVRLYQFEISPFCDKIRRALRYKGVAFEVENIPVATSMFAIRKVNPIGKLPCLDLDGTIVADSTEIAEAIERAFPSPPLYPKSARERALVHLLEDWADESLYYYEMRLRFGIRRNAARWMPKLLAHDPPWVGKTLAPILPMMLDRQLKAQGVGRKPDELVVREVERHARALGDLLGDGDWLVGDSLTIADLAVYAQMHCIRGAEEGEKIVAANRTLAAWMDRVEAKT